MTKAENVESLHVIKGFGIAEVFLKRHPDKATEIIDFLRSQGTAEDCQKFRAAFEPTIRYDAWKYREALQMGYRGVSLEDVVKEVKIGVLTLIYKNYIRTFGLQIQIIKWV